MPHSAIGAESGTVALLFYITSANPRSTLAVTCSQSTTPATPGRWEWNATHVKEFPE